MSEEGASLEVRAAFMSSPCLTISQLRALFDILVHHQTYSEVEFFKEPEAIDRYGYPFTFNFKNKGDTGNGASSTPLLQLLLLRVVVVVGARDMSASAGITSSPLSGCSASCSAAASASGISGAGSPSTAGQEAPRRGRGMMAWVPNKSAVQQLKTLSRDRKCDRV